MKKIIFITVISLCFFWNCEDMPNMGDKKDSVAPGPVTNVVVYNKNGGAEITYSLPEDNDLLGVKAVYTLKNDEKHEMFSSAYRNTIELNGFPNTEERSITLISLDNSFNESTPVEVKIKPLIPPIELIRESFQVAPAFGGIYAKWDNVYKENIVVTLMFKDSLGFWQEDDTHYSVSEEGEFSFRGFEPVEGNFRIQLRDKWGNFSEPFDFAITPYYEEEILPYNPDQPLKPLWDIAYGYSDDTREWRGDFLNPQGGGFRNMFSGARHTWGIVIDGETNVYNNRWGSINKPTLKDYYPDNKEDLTYLHPLYFIFDFNERIVPSRFKLWAMWLSECFPNKIEIWGTTAEPIGGPSHFDNITESLNYWTEWKVRPFLESEESENIINLQGTDAWKDDWILLGDIQIRPTPSGAYQDGDWTPEDIERRDRGYEIEVYPDVVGTEVRYVRFVYYDVQASQIYTTNIKVWGQYTN